MARKTQPEAKQYSLVAMNKHVGMRKALNEWLLVLVVVNQAIRAFCVLINRSGNRPP